MTALIFILIQSVIQHVIVPDTTVFLSDGRFKGQLVVVNEDTLYKGTIRDNKFNTGRGYWDLNWDKLHLYIINGAGDIIYRNNSYDNDIASKSCWFWELLEINRSSLKKCSWTEWLVGDEDDRWIRYKTYKPKTREWQIISFIENTDYANGIKYSDDFLHDWDWTSDDNIMWNLALSIILIWGLYMLLTPISGNHRYLIPNKVSIIIGIVLFVGYCFLDRFTRKQMITPIIIASVFYILYLFINNDRIKQITLLLSFVFLIGGESYQFFILKDTAYLHDGKKVQLNWRRGTDVIKRMRIKRIINNMIPIHIPDSDGNLKYTVYINKYEFTNGDKGIVSDALFGCINSKRPLYNISYREAQLLTENMCKLTGLKFDLPTLDEFNCAKKDEYSYEYYADEKKVNNGKPNAYGLYHMTSNVPEYTSSYSNMKTKIGLAGDTLIKSYDYVFVDGGVYICGTNDIFYSLADNHIQIYSVVNKNYNIDNCGFRLVYRPDNIGSREFVIKGVLRNDKHCANYPKHIQLLSIDSHEINSMPNYESFQEKLIERRFHNSKLTAIDLTTNELIQLDIEPGYEPYDFYPEFSFNGTDINQILLVPKKEVDTFLTDI
ncbi:MAG: hypothetical protein J6W12_07470 [Bacteroidales bacterium]|nr:hypothetical protein [Bacteroidales bacterium]